MSLAEVIQFPAAVETPAALTKFVVGQVYSCRSVCDHNAVWSVIARTEKRLVLQSAGCVQAEEKTEHVRCGVKVFDGQECVWPLGRYSMSPILRA